jgi:hypothetical protein
MDASTAHNVTQHTRSTLSDPPKQQAVSQAWTAESAGFAVSACVAAICIAQLTIWLVPVRVLAIAAIAAAAATNICSIMLRRLKRHGLRAYLPKPMLEQLQKTYGTLPPLICDFIITRNIEVHCRTLLEFLRDDNLGKKISPYIPILFGLDNAETQIYLEAAPPNVRSNLLRPGLAHMLPSGLHHLLLGNAEQSLGMGEQAAKDAVSAFVPSAEMWAVQPPAVMAAVSGSSGESPKWPAQALRAILQRRFLLTIIAGFDGVGLSGRRLTMVGGAASLAALVAFVRGGSIVPARYVRIIAVVSAVLWVLRLIRQQSDNMAKSNTSTATATAAVIRKLLRSPGRPNEGASNSGSSQEMLAALNHVLLPALPYGFLSPGKVTAAYTAVRQQSSVSDSTPARPPSVATRLTFDGFSTEQAQPVNAPPVSTGPRGASPLVALGLKPAESSVVSSMGSGPNALSDTIVQTLARLRDRISQGSQDPASVALILAILLFITLQIKR